MNRIKSIILFSLLGFVISIFFWHQDTALWCLATLKAVALSPHTTLMIVEIGYSEMQITPLFGSGRTAQQWWTFSYDTSGAVIVSSSAVSHVNGATWSHIAISKTATNLSFVGEYTDNGVSGIVTIMRLPIMPTNLTALNKLSSTRAWLM